MKHLHILAVLAMMMTAISLQANPKGDLMAMAT